MSSQTLNIILSPVWMVADAIKRDPPPAGAMSVTRPKKPKPVLSGSIRPVVS